MLPNARWDIRPATKVGDEVVVVEEATIIMADHHPIRITEADMAGVATVHLQDPMATTITLPLEGMDVRLEDMPLHTADITTLRTEMVIINADIARDGIRDRDSRIMRKDRGRGNLNITTISNADTRPITGRDTKIVNIMAVIRSNTITPITIRGDIRIGDIMAVATTAATAARDKPALAPFWTAADCAEMKST